MLILFSMRIPLTTVLVFFSILAYSQPDIPEHGGFWVHDEANVLSAQSKNGLESILQAERDSTSNQIAILIIPSLEGGSLEEYTLRVAEKWRLGKSDKDNGALLFIAIEDRLMRIETGYGLEGSLTDAISSRIIRNEIAPHFRNGDYEAGVEAGVMGIINAIKGEYVNEDPLPETRHAKRFP